jgi:predicted RNA binding protein YcfA (HicA-like mRNA interferase family)
MPKPARPKKVVKHLVRNGFMLIRQRGSHAHYRHPDGRWTTVPMHNRDLPAGTLRAIFKRTEPPIEDF